MGCTVQEVNAQKRSDYIHELLKECRATVEGLRIKDVGRDCIKNELRSCCERQNRDYAVINGMDIPENLVHVISVADAKEIILASDGYPLSYQKGFEIQMSEKAREKTYVAGAVLKDGKLLSNGGRVLGVTATANTLPDAIAQAYELAGEIHFDNAFYRRDIGKRALRALEE